MKILYICDVPNWAMDNNGKALQKYGRNSYDIRYGKADKYRTAFNGLNKYDLVIYSTDIRPDKIIKASVPKDKLIMLIRCDVFRLCSKGRNNFYKYSTPADRKVSAFMIANEYLYEKVRAIHTIPCYYAPGGVDLCRFKKKARVWGNPPRVGWAGSHKFFGPKLRGTDLVEQACAELKYTWNPAIKEVRHRNSDEMAQYYQNEIDIYIDASETAGRQNGLLEAGACGLPLITTTTGIGRELIEEGAAIPVERTVESICEALHEAWWKREKYSRKAYNHICDKWSWKRHVEWWEQIFEGVVDG